MKNKLLPILLVFICTFSIFGCDENKQAKNSENTAKNMVKDEIELPKTIKEFVEAVNKGDEEKFLSFFDKETGTVNDWGREFVGHEAIKQWSDKEFIGAKGKITPTKVEQKDNEVTLWAGWKSNFYTGDSKFIFTLDGEKIKEMLIPKK